MLAKFERFTVNVCRVMIVFQNLCKLVSSHTLTCLIKQRPDNKGIAKLNLSRFTRGLFWFYFNVFNAKKNIFFILNLLIQCTCSPWYAANARGRPLDLFVGNLACYYQTPMKPLFVVTLLHSFGKIQIQ